MFYSTSSINGIHYHHKQSLVTFTSGVQVYPEPQNWRCQDRRCSGRVVTDTNDQIVSCNDKHTYPPKATETAVAMVKERMKESKHHAVGCRWTVNQEEEEIQTS